MQERLVSIARSVAAGITVFFFQAEDGIRYTSVTGVQTCALPILRVAPSARAVSPHLPPVGGPAARLRRWRQALISFAPCAPGGSESIQYLAACECSAHPRPHALHRAPRLEAGGRPLGYRGPPDRRQGSRLCVGFRPAPEGRAGT